MKKLTQTVVNKQGRKQIEYLTFEHNSPYTPEELAELTKSVLVNHLYVILEHLEEYENIIMKQETEIERLKKELKGL